MALMSFTNTQIRIFKTDKPQILKTYFDVKNEVVKIKFKVLQMYI